MKFWEALKEASEGKKIRVSGWPKHVYIFMGHKELLDHENIPWKECMFFGGLCCLNLKWEIFEDTNVHTG